MITVTDVGEVAGAVVPYLSAAAGAYGAAVVQRVADQVEDATADAAVGLGRRLLRRLLRSAQAPAISTAVTDLAEHPDEDDFAAVVRVQVRKALTEDAELLQEMAAMVAGPVGPAGTFTVSVTGSQGVQVGHRNTQTNISPPIR